VVHQFIGGLVRPLLHEPADGEHLAEGVTRCACAFIDYANGWLLANPEMSGKGTDGRSRQAPGNGRGGGCTLHGGKSTEILGLRPVKLERARARAATGKK
jgi:hypothetical protein